MKNTLRIAAFMLALLSLLSLFSFVSCQKEEEPLVDDSGVLYVESKEVTNFVCIRMDSGKKIVLELYPEYAPITVKNFQDLVEKDFYDGLTFHRISPSFVIQGGDPEGNGQGGPGYEIKGEFSSNGVENPLSHKRGVLSMARATDPDSGGSQFFICLSTPYCQQLDGDYAAFGKVVAGMDVVDEISSVQCAGETPLEKQVMEEVYFVEKAESQSATAE